MPKNNVAVVIPIYKEKLTASEELSLKKCAAVLYKYPLIFVAPDNLDCVNYTSLTTSLNPKIIRFANHFFKNVDGYNQLMLSPDFYKRFFDYKYILIYQLDAFVFKDELQYWCEQGYDFIGAPQYPERNEQGQIQFLKNYSSLLTKFNAILRTHHQVSNVGNGGFSLRKVRKFYWMLKLLKRKVKSWGTYNEDIFFRYWGNIFYPFFKLPPDIVALRFSIETSPKESLQNLNGELPFGCHAFEKYDLETWKPFIFPDKVKSIDL